MKRRTGWLLFIYLVFLFLIFNWIGPSACGSPCNRRICSLSETFMMVMPTILFGSLLPSVVLGLIIKWIVSLFKKSVSLVTPILVIAFFLLFPCIMILTRYVISDGCLDLKVFEEIQK